MNYTHCPRYTYFNNNTCIQCSDHQEIFTILTFTFCGIFSLFLFFKYFEALCPIFLLFIIGISQLLCYEKWPLTGILIISIIEIIVIVIGFKLIYNKYENRKYQYNLD